jgi:hypothetical protein
MRLTRDLKYKTELKHVSHLGNVFFSILGSCHIGSSCRVWFLLTAFVNLVGVQVVPSCFLPFSF